ncbi:MAG: porphobilinogen synthase [Bacteroidetes bacterium]|nr:porphobilinogen synthase [Bacteroidota bacterium]
MSSLTIPEIAASSRTRRTRSSERLRRLVRETSLEPRNLILPIFVTDEHPDARNEIASMPGVYQHGINSLLSLCDEAAKAGLGGVILFGVTTDKDDRGSSGYSPDGIVPQAIRAIKTRVPDLMVSADVCLCEYTSHGHCGIVHETHSHEFEILNDETVDLLTREAVVYAEAGADLIAPSDMMDGRIGAIRSALDDAGFVNTPIMSYSAKYASGFYGPFRDAAGSIPSFGDRRSHQMDPANSDEAVRVMERDLHEGADILMVKPAMSYLDIIQRAKDEFDVPIAAYQVSGEYSMIKAAAENGWLDGDRMMLETLTSIKRAGATIILTYFALEAATRL